MMVRQRTQSDDDEFSSRLQEMRDEELLTYIRETASRLDTLADRLERVVSKAGEDEGDEPRGNAG